MRICKKCGAQFPDDHNFCSKCGEKYSENTASPADQLKMPITNLAQDNNLVKYLPLGVIILGCIIAWELSLLFGLILCIAGAFYSYQKYNNSKADLDKISMIIGAAASVLIIILIAFS